MNLWVRGRALEMGEGRVTARKEGRLPAQARPSPAADALSRLGVAISALIAGCALDVEPFVRPRTVARKIDSVLQVPAARGIGDTPSATRAGRKGALLYAVAVLMFPVATIAHNLTAAVADLHVEPAQAVAEEAKAVFVQDRSRRPVGLAPSHSRQDLCRDVLGGFRTEICRRHLTTSS